MSLLLQMYNFICRPRSNFKFKRNQEAYIYINNQPSTNTPPDKNATSKMEYNGLIPGIIDDILEINPLNL